MPVSVSVIVNVYAHRRFVDAAIDSILHQRGDPQVEIILLNAIEGYEPAASAVQSAQKRGFVLRSIRVPRGPVGVGLVRGYDESTGEVICVLDEDDLWEPGKILAVEEAFKDTRVVYFHHGQVFVGEDNRPLPATNLHRLIRHPSSLRSEGLTRVVDSTDSPALSQVRSLEPDFNNSSISVRRRIIGENRELVAQVARGEDSVLFCCALASRRLLSLSTDRLTRYRVHTGGVTAFSPTDSGRPDRLTGYVEDTERRLRQLLLLKQMLEGPGSAAAMQYLLCEQAFYSTLRSTGLAGSGPKLTREWIRMLLGGDYSRPRPREMLTAALGVGSAVSPVICQKLLGFWRDYR